MTTEQLNRIEHVNTLLLRKKSVMLILEECKKKKVVAICQIMQLNLPESLQHRASLNVLLRNMIAENWLKRERFGSGYKYEITEQGDNVLKNGISFK